MNTRINWHSLAAHAAARRERQIPITASDVADVQAVAEAALKNSALTSSCPVKVTTARGGLIVQVSEFPTTDCASTLRGRLEQLGYVLAATDFGRNAVVVTGRDPQHTWNEVAGNDS